MTVGILVDCFYYELGHSDFVHSFFSTISYHLEKEGWGTKYPLIMNELYNDTLNWDDVSVAKSNLNKLNRNYQNTLKNMLYGILMIYHKNLRGGIK